MHRNTYTKIFLKAWDKSIDDTNVEFYSKKWWFSQGESQQHSLRLSNNGYDFLVNTLQLIQYHIDFIKDEIIPARALIFLNKIIDCPFYLQDNRIYVFSEKKSFELYLFADDVLKYGFMKIINARKNNTEI